MVIPQLWWAVEKSCKLSVMIWGEISQLKNASVISLLEKSGRVPRGSCHDLLSRGMQIVESNHTNTTRWSIVIITAQISWYYWSRWCWVGTDEECPGESEGVIESRWEDDTQDLLWEKHRCTRRRRMSSPSSLHLSLSDMRISKCVHWVFPRGRPYK